MKKILLELGLIDRLIGALEKAQSSYMTKWTAVEIDESTLLDIPEKDYNPEEDPIDQMWGLGLALQSIQYSIASVYRAKQAIDIKMDMIKSADDDDFSDYVKDLYEDSSYDLGKASSYLSTGKLGKVSKKLRGLAGDLNGATINESIEKLALVLEKLEKMDLSGQANKVLNSDAVKAIMDSDSDEGQEAAYGALSEFQNGTKNILGAIDYLKTLPSFFNELEELVEARSSKSEPAANVEVFEQSIRKFIRLSLITEKREDRWQ